VAQQPKILLQGVLKFLFIMAKGFVKIKDVKLKLRMQVKCNARIEMQKVNMR
jgi:hypothetical protein